MRIQMGTATRLFALVLATSTVLSISLGIAVHWYVLHLTNERLDVDLLRSAHSIASLLNQDETARVSREGRDAAQFAQYNDLVGRVQQSAGIGGVYTCVPSGENGCVIGLDSQGGTGRAYEYAQLDPEVAEAWRKAAAGGEAVTPIYNDEYGSWKSALIAVKDENGKVVYLLGVDLAAGFVQNKERSLLWVILGGVAVITLVWIAIAFLITRRVVGPVIRTLKRIQAVVSEVAAGNLMVAQIEKTGDTDLDRTGEALSTMVERLRTLVKAVVGSAQFVVETTQGLTSASAQSAQSADEAAQGVGRVATGTGEQADLAADVNHTVAQVKQAIEQIAQGANQSGQEVQGASQLMGRTVEALAAAVADADVTVKGAAMATQASHQGAAEVARTLDGMKRIRVKVTESSGQVHQLHQLSAQIDEITAAISGIAEQTNLLALNAAIEAARAGEHGRGFSVVADEVRKLAERSATSAHQIADLIGEIQQSTAAVVQSMQEGAAEVAQGIQFADAADAALKRIQEISDQAAGATNRTAAALAAVQQDAQQMATAFTNVAAVTEENSAATQEMSAGATQVTDAIARIAQLSQENAAAAQQVSASTEELAATAEEVSASVQALEQIAEDLRNQVSHFRL